MESVWLQMNGRMDTACSQADRGKTNTEYRKYAEPTIHYFSSQDSQEEEGSDCKAITAMAAVMLSQVLAAKPPTKCSNLTSKLSTRGRFNLADFQGKIRKRCNFEARFIYTVM